MVFKELPASLGKTIYDEMNDEMSSNVFISVDPKEAGTSTDNGEQDVVVSGNIGRFYL